MSPFSPLWLQPPPPLTAPGRMETSRGQIGGKKKESNRCRTNRMRDFQSRSRQSQLFCRFTLQVISFFCPSFSYFLLRWVTYAPSWVRPREELICLLGSPRRDLTASTVSLRRANNISSSLPRRRSGDGKGRGGRGRHAE